MLCRLPRMLLKLGEVLAHISYFGRGERPSLLPHQEAGSILVLLLTAEVEAV